MARITLPGSGSGGALASASYVTVSAEASLSNETLIGAVILPSGLVSARPAAGVPGRLYPASDNGVTYRDNGVTWDVWATGQTYAADESTLHLAAGTFSVKSGGIGDTQVSALSESKVTNLTTDLAAKMGALARTAVKTANYTAVAGDLVPCDTTSGAFTVTLPNAPADKSVVAIKHVIQGGTNAVTYACAGSDVFNKTGGATTGTLSLLAQAVLLEYTASGAIWTVIADDLTLASLDGRFAPIASPTFTGTVTIPTGASITAPSGLVKGDVGLGNVDNTSDATKNAASVTLTNKTLTSPVINTGVSGTAIDTDSTFAANSDTILATQKAIKTALALKANLAGPTFTGTTTIATLALTNPATVPNGGTGLGTLTAHAVYVGNGTSAPNPVALGSSGAVLTSNGASSDPTFQAVPDSPSVQILSRQLFK